MWSLAFVALVACGGPKPQPTTVPLPPEPSAAVAEPTKPAEEPTEPTEPAQPAGPIEVTVPVPPLTVKLISAGKGAKAPARYAAKPGDKQRLEIALDFMQEQGEQGKPPATAIIPTIVLGGEVEVKAIAPDGMVSYELTIATSDARDVKGAIATADQLKTMIAPLVGLVIGSTVDPRGAQGDLALRSAAPAELVQQALQIVMLTFPTLPTLPAEPIAVGAKWQATGAIRLAGKVAALQTTDYEATAHKGATWTIKGTTKITGAEQNVDGAKITGIKGSGTTAMTLVEGALFPTLTSAARNEFTVTAPDGAQIVFSVKIGGAITPAK
jgi:hypothetical protein